MEVHDLKSFTKGWFLGDFSPTLLKTPDFEVAVKRYEALESESRHLHKVATEYTVVVSGRVQMNGREYGANDIIVIAPGEATDFVALQETVTVVIKTPSVKDDKYLEGAS